MIALKKRKVRNMKLEEYSYEISKIFKGFFSHFITFIRY